ncbi:MAG: ATP-binding protein [Desulfosalsimonadaceae bacterium]
MYISKIRLENVRCFSNETIKLGESHPSLLIAGNNATGKSSVLRSIAMGLCDEASAGGLLRELPGDFIRTGEKEATIEIEFTEEDGEKWIIETKLKLYKKFNFERVEQKYYKNEVKKEEVGENWQKFPWEKLFIVGYGAGLRTDGTADYDQYFSGDAVYTLFKYSQTLQNPELAWRRLESVAKTPELKEKINENISGILRDVLDLDADSTVQLKPNGIFIVRDRLTNEDMDSENKKSVELSSAGDGFRAITTLIIDLLSWQFLMQNKDCENEKDWKPLSLKDIKGIVIIDEIEKHLHPLLQRLIIEHLYSKFKNIQFIISTHSPLCVSGTADIGEYDAPRYKIFCSYIKDDATSGLDEYEIPRGLRYDQILIDYFRLKSTINRKLQEKIDTLQTLLMKQKNLEPYDAEELKRLDEELKKEAPLLSEREEDRIAEKETREITEKLRAVNLYIL